MTDQPLSLRGLSRLLGVDDKAVRKAWAAGVFSDGSIHRDATGKPSVVNVTLAVTEWKRSGRLVRSDEPPSSPPAAAPAPEQPPPGDPNARIAALLAEVRTLRQGVAAPPEESDDDQAGAAPDDDDARGLTLVEAQKETHIQRARMLRMENDLREGTLVEATAAAKVVFEFSRTLREAILNVPARISAELAAESDAARVHIRLDSALREALTSVAVILEQSPPAAPPPAAG